MLRWLILPFFLAVLSLAQTHSSQTGVVRANGIPVPGAEVKATQGETTLTTLSGDQGQYTLDSLTDGTWTIEVRMFGFDVARKEVNVHGASQQEWSLTLKSLTASAAPKESVAAARTRPGPGGQGGPANSQPGSAGRSGAGGPQQARNQPARNQQARNQQARNQSVELTNQLAGTDNLGPAASASTELPNGAQSDSANEAFLLNGSVSRGLQQVSEDPGADFGPGFGRGPGQFGDDGNPQNQGGAFGAGGGAASSSGPGGGGGFGGPGGGGGFGGGGGGGRGGFGGPGGGGGFGGRGPGGQGGQYGRRRTDTGLMGNRRNRGQQGIHGLVNVVLHNSLLDARPFAINGQDVPKPSYSQERFSIQIGGPLMIPKLFRLENTTFNFNYTINRADNLSSQVGSVPSALERTGNFSQIGQTVYDPTTQQPFPGNIVPLNRISPIALGLLEFIPNPNQPGLCAGGQTTTCDAQNFRFTTTAPNNNQNIGLRLGQSVGKKDRLALNFQFQNRNSLTPQIFGFLDNSHGLGVSSNLSWTHIFAPRIFNIASVNFNRNRTSLLPFFANSTDIATQLGIQGTSTNPINFGPPNLSFTNFSSLSDGSASLVRVQALSVTDAFNILHGKHNFGFGTVVRRAQNNVQTDSNARGTFNFTGLRTSGFDSQGNPLPNTGYDLADYLLGQPNASSIRYGDTSTYFRNTDYAFYGQDDWHLLPNVTVNYGLRYEYFGVPHELYGHEANLDINPDFTAVALVLPGQSGPYTGQYPSGLVNPDRNNFAPRLGVAWRPWKEGKTVVRSGYGIYYNGAAYNAFARNLAGQPPFAITNSVISSTAAPLTLAEGFVTILPGKTITNSWAVNRFYRIPYAQTWNFSIQQDLPGRLVLQAGYVGTKGTNLDTQQLPNRALPGSQQTTQERLIIADANSFVYESSDANSIYNAARVSLIRRFSHGVSFNFSYVFSKAIDDASTFGGGVAQNDLDIRAERSLSNFDRRHVFTGSYVLTSPVGHNSALLSHSAWAQKLLEDWTWSGSVTAETGTPLNPKVGGNLSDSAGTGALGTTRPDATGIPVDSGSGFLNTAAFVLPVPGSFGDAGRNTIPGPGLVTANASFGRSFPFGDRRSFEFRLDGTNVLNHVNISSFGTTINASNYGLALSASAMRSVSVTLRLRF
jgi:trimeric autotransporter adhesin